MRTRFTKSHQIPSLGSRKMQTTTASFADGILTYPPNDGVKNTAVVLAQDTRFSRIGRYTTRPGNRLLLDAVGKEVVWSSAGFLEVNKTFDVSDEMILMQSFVAPSNFRLWQIDLTVAMNPGASGVVEVSVWSSNAGSPLKKLATSCIDPSVLTGVSTVASVHFTEAPDLTSGEEYFVIVQCQKDCTGSFAITTSTYLTGLQYSTTGGVLWDDAGAGLIMKIYSATPGEIGNIFVANNGGVFTTFFLFNNILYRADDSGNISVQNDSLPPGTKHIQFDQTENIVRYTCETGNPRKIRLSDFAEEAIQTGRGNVRSILWHIAYLFYLSADNRNGIFTSEAAPDGIDLFDATRSFVADIPQSNSGDDLRAVRSLAGTLFFFTLRNKYALMGNAWQTFTASDAAAQKGTFSQESTVSDTSFIYYAAEDGIYKFNGSSEVDITAESVQDFYSAILDKESIKLDIFDNRLFVFYASNGSAHNDSCMVYNLNLGVFESFDTGAYVSATCARGNRRTQFLQGHSRVGAIMVGEEPGNQHHNIGAPLKYELATAFLPFGAPHQKKRVSKHRPEFATAARRYQADIGYAKDFDANVNYAGYIELSTGHVTWNSGRLWDDGELWGSRQRGTVLTTRPRVNGEFRRLQIRYRHHAAFEPVTFEEHTVVTQTQRIR